MIYSEAVDYYNGLSRHGMKLGLERIEELLHKIGEPDKGQRFIHIAGTNGKGSIANFIHSMLSASGCKVGLYTSPHLIRINETIKIGNEYISNAEFANLTAQVKKVIESDCSLSLEEFTYYEVLTAAAILYFKQQECDFVILEVGLGGRLDATNVIKSPLVSVISKISYDHMNVLGNSIEAITTEKAGIIKDNGLVVLSPQEFDGVQPIIEAFCRKHNASLKPVNEKELSIHSESSAFEQSFDYKDIKNIKIQLLGRHQISNAITAVEVIRALKEHGINLKEEDILNGLAATKWPCRLELISKTPKIFIDGAHNIDGINAVADFFKTNYKDKKIKFIFGVLRDKNYKEMVEIIAPLAESIFTVSPNSDRALSAEELSKVVMEHNVYTKPFDSIEDAVNFTLAQAGDEAVLCICGSLYYVGEARDLIINR